MPEILVLRQPDDDVYDRIEVDANELGERVEEVYEELNADYTIEILYDNSPRANVYDS